MIGALLSDIGVVAPGHQGAGVGVLLLDGNFRDHGLSRGQLVLAAEGHQDGPAADGGVKPLGQAALGADVQVSGQVQVALPEVLHLVLQDGLGLFGNGGDVLLHAVGIQEGAGDIYNGVAVPGHGQAALAGDGGHNGGFQVLLGSQLHEAGGVLGLDDHGHALLGFTDGQLGPIQALVLLGHLVQVDVQALGQLADGDGHAARAEVIAALDKAGDLTVTEQTLDLALFGGVALLDLARHGGEGLQIVALRRTRRAADAVAAGAAAEQDDDVARGGPLAHDVLRGRRGDDCAALKTFGDIALVIELGDVARGKADLVAVG